MTAATTREIRSIRYVGVCPRASTERWFLVGQDGGQSIPMGDETLFVFSDTLIAARAGAAAGAGPRIRKAPPPAFHDLVRANGMFLANCAGIARGTTVREAWANLQYIEDNDGFPKEILPATDWEWRRGLRFWPEHGVYHDGLVYLFYLAVQVTDPTTIWGFRGTGVGVAKLDPRSGECERLEWTQGATLRRVWGSETRFGVQVLPWEEHLYVFASVPDGYYHQGRLARVKPSGIAEPQAYEYLSAPGPEWSSNANSAASLGPCGGDYSVTYNAHLGCFVMLYLDEYEKRLVLRTAEHPWGPYSEPQSLIGAPHEESTELAYLGFEHPAFAQEGGRRVYVSYCQPRFQNNSLLALTFR